MAQQQKLHGWQQGSQNQDPLALLSPAPPEILPLSKPSTRGSWKCPLRLITQPHLGSSQPHALYSRMDGSGHTCTSPVRRRLLAAALSASSSSLPLLLLPQPPNPASAQGSSHSLPAPGRPRCAPRAALGHGAGASVLPAGLPADTRGVAGCDDAQREEVEELVGRGAAPAGPAEGCRLAREPSDGRPKRVPSLGRAPALLHSGVADSGAAQARLPSGTLGSGLHAPRGQA